VFTRARWPVMLIAWAVAVVLITFLTSRVIHVVGRQLSSTVALPHAKAAPPVSVGSSPPAPESSKHPRPSHSPAATGSPVASGRSGDGQGSTARATNPPPAGSTPGPHQPAPTPRVFSPAPPPPVVTDQQTVQTAGGQAAFTCTSADRLALLYATPAPGYTTEAPRVRSSSRLDVTFAGPQDQKIDARCSDGHLQADVEV